MDFWRFVGMVTLRVNNADSESVDFFNIASSPGNDSSLKPENFSVCVTLQQHRQRQILMS